MKLLVYVTYLNKYQTIINIEYKSINFAKNPIIKGGAR